MTVIAEYSNGIDYLKEIDNNKVGILKGAKAKYNSGVISKNRRKFLPSFRCIWR